jgi:hypothetical protein
MFVWMERQRDVLLRDSPPVMTFIVDEMALIYLS